METLAKLKTGHLNLLLDFCCNQPILARLSLPVIKQELDLLLKDVYFEITENLVNLKGVDLRSYTRSVVYALKSVNLETYAISIRFLNGNQYFPKLRRMVPQNLMHFYRYPVTDLLDEGMTESEIDDRLTHVLTLLQFLGSRLEEAIDFVENSYQQSKKVNRLLLDEADCISKELERDQEELFRELLKFTTAPDTLVNLEISGEFYRHTLHVHIQLSSEIENNYYRLNLEVTKPYLLQIKQFFKTTSITLKQYKKENPDHQEMVNYVLTQLKGLEQQVNYLLEIQREKPYLKTLEALLNGSDLERVLIHLKKKMLWYDGLPSMGTEKYFVEECQTLGDKKVLKQMYRILKQPRDLWPKEARETLENLTEYWERESRFKNRLEGVEDLFFNMGRGKLSSY